MSSWVIVDWDDEVGISYEPTSKLKLLEETEDWSAGSTVEQNHNSKVYTGTILSCWGKWRGEN